MAGCHSGSVSLERRSVTHPKFVAKRGLPLKWRNFSLPRSIANRREGSALWTSQSYGTGSPNLGLEIIHWTFRKQYAPRPPPKKISRHICSLGKISFSLLGLDHTHTQFFAMNQARTRPMSRCVVGLFLGKAHVRRLSEQCQLRCQESECEINCPTQAMQF